MTKLKIAVLGLVVLSQVLYFKFIVLSPAQRQSENNTIHTNLPPNYRVVALGKYFVWESNLGPDYGWWRGCDPKPTEKECVADAWRFYLYEMDLETNKWTQVK